METDLVIGVYGRMAYKLQSLNMYVVDGLLSSYKLVPSVYIVRGGQSKEHPASSAAKAWSTGRYVGSHKALRLHHYVHGGAGHTAVAPPGAGGPGGGWGHANSASRKRHRVLQERPPSISVTAQPGRPPVGHRVGVAVRHGGDELPEVEPRLVLAQVQPCVLRVLPPIRHVPCFPEHDGTNLDEKCAFVIQAKQLKVTRFIS